MNLGYHAPEDLDEALDLLTGGAARLIAGGTDFYPALGPGRPKESLIDITRIEGLRGIAGQEGGGWRIGAATRWSDVARADLPPAFDGLKAAAREVGSLQIQNAGTVAGNLCNASPAADGVPPLLALGAEVEIASAHAGRRRMALKDFITGVRQVALEPGEMVTALHIPALPEGARGGFAKLGSRAYLVISIVMASAVIRCDGAGRIDHARVAVGACSPVARRLGALERDMIGQRPGDIRLRPAHLQGLAPIDDIRGSAGYRLEAVGAMLERLIAEVCDG